MLTRLIFHEACSNLRQRKYQKLNSSGMTWSNLVFRDNSFDGLVPFYSMIYVPKRGITILAIDASYWLCEQS